MLNKMSISSHECRSHNISEFFFSSRRRHTSWNCDWSSDVCSSDLSAELPAVMVALDASFVLRSRSGERKVKAADFFTGLFVTALEKGELLTAVEIPARPDRKSVV